MPEAIHLRADQSTLDPGRALRRAQKSTSSRLVFFALVFLAACLVGWLPFWQPADARLLILFLSGPLFIAACVVPVLILKDVDGKNSALALLIISVIYLLAFGVKSYYLLWAPNTVIYPNFDANRDLLFLHRGLLWSGLGIVFTAAGYAILRPLRVGGSSAPPRFIRFNASALFGRASTLPVAVGLYGLGLIGRARSLTTGSALYLYNSPAFDQIAARARGPLDGLLDILADLCPLAFAVLLAYRVTALMGPRKRRWLDLLLLAIVGIELFYYSFGVYKFGILGTLIILWAVKSVAARTWSRSAIVLALVFVVLVIPIANVVREASVSYYATQLGPSMEWLQLASESAQETLSNRESLGSRTVLDQFFERMNGAEAVGVAEKYLPYLGYERGRTYLNLLLLSIPRFLRPGSGEPYYINWAVDYVGLAPTNPTVMPMPFVVEAYVSFGLPAILVVMLGMGLVYRLLDRFAVSYRRYSAAIGLYAYMLWRCANVEHNLFIFLPATLKTVFVALVLFWLLGRLSGGNAVAATDGRRRTSDDSPTHPELENAPVR